MKHFHAGRHQTAAQATPALVVSLLLASASTSAVIAAVVDQSRSNCFEPAVYTQSFNDAIDHLNQVRANISTTIGRLNSEDTGAVEVKDVDHVIYDLISNGYLESVSPVIDLLKTHEIEVSFEDLDELVDTAIQTLMYTRDNIVVDSTDDYLGLTVPLVQAMTKLTSFGQDLHVVIAATWRDYNNRQTFALGSDSPAEARQTTAASA